MYDFATVKVKIKQAGTEYDKISVSIQLPMDEFGLFSM
jgi:hypothetical protein